VIAITILVLGAEAALFAAGCTRAPSLPQARVAPLAADTTLALAGLTGPARIVTDVHGIVHVRAENLADLYRAWGFVTARDRLWQMVYTRQSARGDLWRWFGNRALRADGGAQLFELADRVDRIWARERSDSAQRVALEAYADGVNAWMDLCRSGAVSWPVELQRLDKVPDPWRPEDAYLVLFGMSFVLDFDLPELREQSELERDGAAGFRTRRRFEDDFVYATIPDAVARRRWGGDSTGTARPIAMLPAQDPDALASDVFAVGPARSASGRPILANDPHLPLATPGPLYAVHVSCAEHNVEGAGATLPGIPAIVSGRNRTCAWGLTALGADVMDVYADTLSPDMKQVKTGDGWQPVREAEFTMRYQAGPLELPTLGQKRRYTAHGPVVTLDTKRHIAYSVRWAGDDSRLSIGRLLGFERSSSADEVAARARTMLTPTLNIVAADVGGHVRYQTIGALPRRGFVPDPGPLPGDGRHEWLGLVPADSMPAWDVPPDQVVVNGNNLPARTFSEPLPRYGWTQERALRMAERLAGDPRITAADARSVQNDVVSRTARRMVPLMLAHLDHSPGALTPRERAAVDSLRGWDFACRRSRVAPTVFRAWYGAFLRRSNLEGLNGLAAAALDGRAPEALVDPVSHGREPAPRAVRAALDTAVVRLAAMLGPDPSRWTWGRAHRARFAHALSWLDPELTPETVAMDGDNVTPSVGRSNLPWDWRVTHGPVWRHVVDLADPNLSWCVIAPGNPSEGSLRTDLADDWARHGYVPLELRWDRIDRSKIGDVRLVPEASTPP
jgi:penicillin amidase